MPKFALPAAILSGSYYGFLGVNLDSTLGDIRSNYVNRRDTATDLREARPNVPSKEQLDEALRVLSDPQARAAYDQELYQRSLHDADLLTEQQIASFNHILDIALPIVAPDKVGLRLYSVGGENYFIGNPDASPRDVSQVFNEVENKRFWHFLRIIMKYGDAGVFVTPRSSEGYIPDSLSSSEVFHDVISAKNLRHYLQLLQDKMPRLQEMLGHLDRVDRVVGYFNATDHEERGMNLTYGLLDLLSQNIIDQDKAGFLAPRFRKNSKFNGDRTIKELQEWFGEDVFPTKLQHISASNEWAFPKEAIDVVFARKQAEQDEFYQRSQEQFVRQKQFNRLYMAICENNHDKVEAIVTELRAAGIEIVNEKAKESPVMWAIREGASINIVEYLVRETRFNPQNFVITSGFREEALKRVPLFTKDYGFMEDSPRKRVLMEQNPQEFQRQKEDMAKLFLLVKAGIFDLQEGSMNDAGKVILQELSDANRASDPRLRAERKRKTENDKEDQKEKREPKRAPTSPVAAAVVDLLQEKPRDARK